MFEGDFMKNFILVRLDYNYCDYLRQFDDGKLYGRSKKLYNKYVNGTLNHGIAKRCCNFTLLEEKCIEYNRIKT